MIDPVVASRLRRLLGALWLLDGVLQLQPYMWSEQFGQGTLRSAASERPELIAAPIRFLASLVAGHPVPFNAVFAGTEILLGLGLLSARRRRMQRLLCIASLAWALGVWVLGEGLGGLAGGSTSMSIGAPGAALFYALLTLACWPSPLRLARWLPAAWALVWVGGAVYQLTPGQASGVGLGAQVEMASMMSPTVLAEPELHLAVWLANLPAGLAILLSAVLAAAYAWIGLAVFSARSRRAALFAGVGASLVFWVLCQGFGGMSTGAATDPGSAPAVILLALAIAAVPAPPRRRSAWLPESLPAPLPLSAPGGALAFEAGPAAEAEPAAQDSRPVAIR
jgi:hypothetical protein